MIQSNKFSIDRTAMNNKPRFRRNEGTSVLSLWWQDLTREGEGASSAGLQVRDHTSPEEQDLLVSETKKLQQQKLPDWVTCT